MCEYELSIVYSRCFIWFWLVKKLWLGEWFVLCGATLGCLIYYWFRCLGRVEMLCKLHFATNVRLQRILKHVWKLSFGEGRGPHIF